MSLKGFIEENLDLIKDNNFNELYKKFTSLAVPKRLTNFLLSCDINPLLYMDEVPKYYMSGDDSIKEVTIPKNIKYVNENAFYNTKINKINIESPDIILAGYSFAFNPELSNINLNNVSFIYEDALRGCDLEELKLNNIEQLGDRALLGMRGLNRIYLGKKLNHIGKNCFYNVNELTDIYYEGSEEDWAKIQIHDSNLWELNNVTIHYNYKF